MDLDKLPLFKAMAQRMTWLGERQKVLAQNVANSDTPNYRARDLQQPSFAELLGKSSKQLHLAATQPQHLTGSAGPAADFRAVVDKDAPLSPSGNSVAIEDQMLKVSGTASDFQVMTSLYKQHVSLLKMVLGRGQ